MDVKKYIFNNEGQAVFEMLAFFPFLIFLFTIIVTMGNSINGSINQQKATRSYFLYAYSNDSMGVPLNDLNKLAGVGVLTTGMYAFGWAEKTEGDNPYAGCYRLQQIVGGDSSEDCFEEVAPGKNSSDFIKVFTAFGICTGVVTSRDGGSSFNLVPEAGAVESCQNSAF